MAYLVTNRHCVEQGGLVARLTKRISRQREPRFFETEEDDWIKHDTSDLAIWPIPEKLIGHNVLVGENVCLTPERMEKLFISAGDPVLVASRLVRDDGGSENFPIVHSGTIARLALVPEFNGFYNRKETAYLVETYSRGGYSGAPVIGYLWPGLETEVLAASRSELGRQVFLVGVLWGYLSHLEPVIDPTKKTPKEQDTGLRVRVPTSLAYVVPAWEILTLLKSEEAVKKRKELDEKRGGRSEPPPETEVTPAFDPGTSTIDRTAALLHKLAQVPPEEAVEVHRKHQS